MMGGERLRLTWPRNQPALPIPHINKRRRKVLQPPSEAPHRSRRLAGLAAMNPEVCPPHLKKRVTRALDLEVDDEKEHIDENILEEYANSFRQPRASSHTRALFFNGTAKRIAVIFIRRKKEVQEPKNKRKTNKTTMYS
jgi:hypothetical protein